MPGTTYRLFTTVDESSQGSRYVTDGEAGAGTMYSSKMQPDREGNLGFTLETTGTLTGTFTLWYSDEDQPNEASDTDWVQDTTWVPTNPAGAATKVKYAIAEIKARWVRVKLVVSGGAGTVYGYYAA